MTPLNGDILVVESDSVDALNIERTIRAANGGYCVRRAVTCDEALRAMQASSVAWPALILLSLDPGRTDGLAFLKTLKADDRLRRIPVVVLSAQRLEHLVAASYALGAAGYILKSDNYEEMSDEITVVLRYWELSVLPEADPGVPQDATCASD